MNSRSLSRGTLWESVDEITYREVLTDRELVSLDVNDYTVGKFTQEVYRVHKTKILNSE